MKFQTLKTYAKNNFPDLSKSEVEEKLREEGFCKTMQMVEFPVFFTPREMAEKAIFDFEDLDTFLDVKEIVYRAVSGGRQKALRIVVFYK